MRIQKLISLLLCLVLCIAVYTAAAVEYNAGNVFTITYDENAYAFDNTAYLEENTREYIWMFMLYQLENDVVVDVSMEMVPEFADLSLLSATSAERSAYVAATLDSYSDAGIKLVDTITVSDLDIPFYVYTMEDENGDYLTAETIVGGWAINFSSYHMKTAKADDALMHVLEEIVGSFVPVT